MKNLLQLPATTVVLALLAGGLTPLAAQDVAFQDVRVFDGDRVIERASVLVHDGRIEAVGEEIELPDHVLVYDGNDRTLLPGLIDAHTHTPFRGMAETALMLGVTTLLDMFTPAEAANAFREEQDAGRAHDRADVFSATVAVTAPGGHGTQFGVAVPTLGPDDDVDAFLAERVAEGADYIKVIHDDGSAYGIAFPTFDADMIAAIVAAAHRHDRMAVVHVGRLRDARVAAAAGADGLVHVWSDELPDEEDVELILDSGMFVVPTLAVMAGIAGRPVAPGLADDERAAPWLRRAERERLRQHFPRREGAPASFDNAIGSVTQLIAAGVPLLAGTDAPNPGTAHGASMHHELQLLVEAGLTPAEALRAATSATADAFGLDDRGRIAPGLRADLLLVEGDPTSDITSTLEIAGIWKEGVVVDRQAFRERLETRVEPGLVSTFDDGTLGSSFGSDWIETTDRSFGGESTVELAVVQGGAKGSSHALRISGEVAVAGPFQWSGTVVFPGGNPGMGADLSAAGGLRFFARGEGSFAVMLFSPSLGPAPILRSFDVTPAWAEFVFPWDDFGSDGKDVSGIGFVAGDPGAFTVYIDEVELR